MSIGAKEKSYTAYRADLQGIQDFSLSLEMTKKMFFPNPLSGKAEERVNERSEVGVSRITNNAILALHTSHSSTILHVHVKQTMHLFNFIK